MSREKCRGVAKEDVFPDSSQISSLKRIRSIAVILTAECNLSCRYCYQNAKKKKRVPWATLKAALDLGIGSGSDETRIIFLGGEPLLEFPMIRRAVEYVEKRRVAGKRVRYHISTNGTLLSEEIIGFLEARSFETQISFDGMAEAQEMRGAGTFQPLDRLFDRLLEKHAGFLRRNVKICLTLTPDTIGQLPGSVDYLLAKGLPNVSIGTSINASTDWDVGRIDELDSAFGRIFESSLRHRQKTGKTPLLAFRGGFEAAGDSKRKRPMCGLAEWKNLTIDVDGEAYGCPVLAGSYQKLDPGSLQGRWDSMRMGSIHDPRFAERFAAFPEATRRVRMFDRKEEKHSAYGRCVECRYFDACMICPCSTAHIPGNSDPNRVSDFCCAFSQVSLRHRERFPRSREEIQIRDGPPGAKALMERWRKMAEAAKSRRRPDEKPTRS